MDNPAGILQQQGMNTASLTPLRGGIYYLTVPGSEALSRWRALRAIVHQTNLWPVLKALRL